MSYFPWARPIVSPFSILLLLREGKTSKLVQKVQLLVTWKVTSEAPKSIVHTSGSFTCFLSNMNARKVHLSTVKLFCLRLFHFTFRGSKCLILTCYMHCWMVIAYLSRNMRAPCRVFAVVCATLSTVWISTYAFLQGHCSLFGDCHGTITNWNTLVLGGGLQYICVAHVLCLYSASTSWWLLSCSVSSFWFSSLTAVFSIEYWNLTLMRRSQHGSYWATLHTGTKRRQAAASFVDVGRCKLQAHEM